MTQNTVIYAITSPSGKVYIGQSCNYYARYRTYMTKRCKHQPKLLNSLSKYGPDKHKFEILFELRRDISQPMLNYWEQFFMDYYRSIGVELLNIKEAGSNGKPSAETIEKMRKSSTGRKHSAESKQKISAVKRGCRGTQKGKFGQNHPMFGYKHAPEFLDKMSRRMRGKDNPSWKGFVDVYYNHELIARAEDTIAAAKIAGVDGPAVSLIINKKRKQTRSGYTFVRCND